MKHVHLKIHSYWKNSSLVQTIVAYSVKEQIYVRDNRVFTVFNYPELKYVVVTNWKSYIFHNFLKVFTDIKLCAYFMMLGDCVKRNDTKNKSSMRLRERKAVLHSVSAIRKRNKVVKF